jgi:hypothetical protein
MMEAGHTSETSVDSHFTRQYIPEDNFEHHNKGFRTQLISVPEGDVIEQISSISADVGRVLNSALRKVL